LRGALALSDAQVLALGDADRLPAEAVDEAVAADGDVREVAGPRVDGAELADFADHLGGVAGDLDYDGIADFALRDAVLENPEAFAEMYLASLEGAAVDDIDHRAAVGGEADISSADAVDASRVEAAAQLLGDEGGSTLFAFGLNCWCFGRRVVDF
jgi:hypothetical protein